MKLRNDLIRLIKEGHSNDYIICKLLDLEYEESDIINEFRDDLDEEAKNTTKELFLDNSLNSLRKTIGLNNKFYEVSKNQISKKVFDNGYGVYFCPNCKGSVWQIKDESKYCFRCGQKLDWS